MGIRHWLRERLSGSETSGDAPLVHALLGRPEERTRTLGEYRSDSYPADLMDLLARRQKVASELLSIDITDPQVRMGSIPRVRELLRTYPHPLAYETLIHAYMDAGRYDEAKGVAFAAQARRLECARSEHPEIRGEIEHLDEWTPEEVEKVRAEREENAREV